MCQTNKQLNVVSTQEHASGSFTYTTSNKYENEVLLVSSSHQEVCIYSC